MICRLWFEITYFLLSLCVFANGYLPTYYSTSKTNNHALRSTKTEEENTEEVSKDVLWAMAGRTSQRKRRRGRKTNLPIQLQAAKHKNPRTKSRTTKPSILKKEIASVSMILPSENSNGNDSIVMANITLVNGTELLLNPQNFHQRDDMDVWLSVRAALDVTASEFSALLNHSYFTSREKLLEIKCGNAKPFSGNAATKWGLRMEPLAFRQYEQVTGNIVNETGLHIYHDSTTSRTYGASPDGLVIDTELQTEGLLEIKCLWGRRNEKELPQYEHCPNRFYDQIQGQLAICDRDWCDLMMYIPPSGKKKRNYCIIRIPRDRDYWTETILPSLNDFCDDVSKTKTK